MPFSRPSVYPAPPKFNHIRDAEDYSGRLYRALVENDRAGEQMRDRAPSADLKALIVRPEWYGAKGDGVTDDTVAIQAAIDALDSGRGGTIHFAPKTYAISSTINLKSNIKYLGHAQMNPTGSELPVTGATLQWVGGTAGDIMVEAFDKTGILWDGINLYGGAGHGGASYDDPITNGLIGIRQWSDNAPISWRNKFRNFEVWYVETACDFGNHVTSYESDMFEISDFNFYKVNVGILLYSYNGTQGSIIENGRIHPFEKGIDIQQVSLLKISRITFGSLSATPTYGYFIEINEIGNQVVIELCQGEGYGLSAWNTIKFTQPYSYSAYRPTMLIANTFNAPVWVAGAYDIIGIGNIFEVQASQLTRAIDLTGNGINYISIGDTFIGGAAKSDTGTGNNFITIGVQGGGGDIDITGIYKADGAQIGQANVSGLATTDTPTFATAKLTNISGGYVPYQSREEHIINGGFDSATTGWTIDAGEGTIASISGGEKGNCLEITRVAETSQHAWQVVADLVVGVPYEFSAYVKSGTSGNEAFQLFYFRTSDDGDSHALDGTSSGSWTKYSMTITPIATSYKFFCIKKSATAGTMLFDSVSVRILQGLADSPLSTDGTDVDNSGVYKVDAVQVVGAQAAAQADLKADYTTGDLDTEAEVIAATNATNAGINTLLAKLRTHGIIDT